MERPSFDTGVVAARPEDETTPASGEERFSGRDRLELPKTGSRAEVLPKLGWIGRTKNWLMGWVPSGEKKTGLRNTIEAARGKLSSAEYKEISDALESVPFKEQHQALSLSIELARNRNWTPSHFAKIITEIQKMNPEQRSAVPIIARATQGRDGDFSRMIALLYESNSQQHWCGQRGFWTREQTTYERFLDHLPKWLENRQGSINDVKHLFEQLLFIGSSDVGDRPEEIFNTVSAMCNERAGDASGVYRVMSDITNFSEARKRLQRRREHTPLSLEHIRELVNNRDGNLFEFQQILNRTPYHGAVITDEQSQIADDMHTAAFNRLISISRGRPGSLRDIDTLNAIIQQLPVERVDQILVDRTARIRPEQPITDLIANLTPFIPRRAPEVRTGVRTVDPLQVHREAAIRMRPLLEFLNEQLEGTRLVSTAESLQKIEQWISETDISHLSEDPERDRARMHSLLVHSKWEAALTARYASLGADVNGELLLRKATTFCSEHPENIQLFLQQSLMDSIIAYVDNPEGLDNISCANGIAERFVLCFRNLASESTLLPDLTRSIYNHPEYQHFTSMGEEDEEEAQKFQWLIRYRGIRDLETLRTTIQRDLKQLQTRLQREAPANTRGAFNTETIEQMFRIFDNRRHISEENRLRKIFEAVQIPL